MSVLEPRKRARRGFVLIAMCGCIFLLLAVVGLAFDLGRIYITRNEAQVFTDAASMAAAAQLDGTAAGVARAKAAVEHLPARWNLGTQPFAGVTAEFSADGRRWDAEPDEVSEVKFARVRAPDNRLDIIFLSAVGGPLNFNVPAQAVAATNPVRLVE